MKRASFIDRLNEKFRPNAECYQWVDKICSSDGYPRIYWAPMKRGIKANRAVWMHFNGPIPDGMFVCHSCDNKLCVRIEHLWLGTPKDNARDMFSKKRNRNPKGEHHPKAKLTEKEVREIRSMRGQLSSRLIGLKFGVSKGAISAILEGRRWAHVL